MSRPTVDELRARIGVPDGELAAGYLAPGPEEVTDFGCINCGDHVGAVLGGDCTCDIHCEGCCDCELEDE